MLVAFGETIFLPPSSCPRTRSMPITCGMRIEPLTTEEFASLDYRVMSCAYATKTS